MPELPEVETLCRQLTPVLDRAVLQKIIVKDARLRSVSLTAGQGVKSVYRVGKSLAVQFEKTKTLLIHLRMTGRLSWITDGTCPFYSRCVLVFDSGRLHLVDPRRFATLSIVVGDSKEKRKLLDPMDEREGRDFMILSAGRRLPVKNFLMDQKTLGGIGNIYACEMLHRAGISPWRRACDMDEQRWRRLSKAMKATLGKAIECRGTTISDWADLFGRKGSYQKQLRVYGRKGKPCPRCGAPVIRTLLSGRATFFCTSCQET